MHLSRLRPGPRSPIPSSHAYLQFIFSGKIYKRCGQGESVSRSGGEVIGGRTMVTRLARWNSLACRLRSGSTCVFVLAKAVRS